MEPIDTLVRKDTKLRSYLVAFLGNTIPQHFEKNEVLKLGTSRRRTTISLGARPLKLVPYVHECMNLSKPGVRFYIRK